MAHIKLHPEDQKKYGTGEVIEFDINRFGVRQRGAVEKVTKRTLRWMWDQLSGVPELDDNGNVIPVPVIDEETGEQKVENGEPVFRERLTRDPEAIAMFVFLVLWGAGVHLDWETFEIVESGLVIELSEDSESDRGKDVESTNSENGSTT